jgi:hypothetical protein
MWSIVIRYAEDGQPFRKDLQMPLTTQSDCLRVLTLFRENLLRSFAQSSFAGEFNLTGTIISIRINPDLPRMTRWFPWNYHVVRVKSACRES